MVATILPVLLLLSSVIAKPLVKRDSGSIVIGSAACLDTIVAGAAITIGATVTPADFGPVNAGAAITGYTNVGPSSATAVTDMNTAIGLAQAYNVNPQSSTMFAAGTTVYAGTYSYPAAAAFPAAFTLSGTATDIFVFKANGAINFAASTVMTLISPVKASNVYFVSNGASTIGASSIIFGNFMAQNAAITLGASVQLTGALYAQAAVSVGASCIITKVGNCGTSGNSNPPDVCTNNAVYTLTSTLKTNCKCLCT